MGTFGIFDFDQYEKPFFFSSMGKYHSVIKMSKV